ncbi:MAG: thioredoxin-disulfide reductase [Candidatus Caldatribacteriota bacterium]
MGLTLKEEILPKEKKKKLSDQDLYDVVIIGGGPAGLTAGIYLSRARMNAVLIEKALPGGQAILTEKIENYPGFPEGVGGPELMQKMEEQALKFGLKIEYQEVKEIKNQLNNQVKLIQTDQKIYQTLAIIVASGAEAKKLGVPGEEELRGKGVSYCATCDAPFFQDKEVVVVGGGDTAIEEALYLAKFAREITVVHRRDRLRATRILQERAFKNKKIKFIWDSVLTSIQGQSKVEGVFLKNLKTGVEKEISCQGVFLFVGYSPNTKFLEGIVQLDEKKYIITDSEMTTSQVGIYACGDVRSKNLRQVITACGEGASAAFNVEKYIEELKGIAY